MIKLLEHILFSWGDFQFTVLQLILIFISLCAAFIIHFLIRGFIREQFRKRNLPGKFLRFLTGTIGWLITALLLVVVVEILGVPVQKLFGSVIYANGDKARITIANVLVAFLVFFFIRIFLFLIEFFLDRRVVLSSMDRGRGHSLMQIVKYLTWLIGGAFIFSSLGFQITFLIASVSALLVGIGFGLQGIFNDVLSGIIILFDGSIEVDDVVELDGLVGRVKKIGIRFSEIITRDNVVMIIPNSKFTSDKVVNWTHNDESTRFYVEVGVAYGSDVRLVEKILLQCAFANEQIETAPAPFVRFNDFGDSSLDFQLFFWTVDDFLVENIKSDLRFDIDQRFRENKVEIPFPQRDIHLKSKNY